MATYREPRWPDFTAPAVALGVRSVLSPQSRTDTQTPGALNMYADAPGGFTARSIDEGAALATQAAGRSPHCADSKTWSRPSKAAMSSARPKEILTERFKISAGQAFQILVAVSQHTP